METRGVLSAGQRLIDATFLGIHPGSCNMTSNDKMLSHVRKYDEKRRRGGHEIDGRGSIGLGAKASVELYLPACLTAFSRD